MTLRALWWRVRTNSTSRTDRIASKHSLGATCGNWMGLTKKPYVDASRIGMSGHSYGGFLTAYALTHSKLFAAGIAIYNAMLVINPAGHSR